MEKLPDLTSLNSDQKDQLIFTLFSFMQELRDEISILKKENAELRRENAELRRENAELRRENAGLRRENAELRRENAELKLEIVKLKNQINRNSQNSSQPPASDGFKRPTHQRPKSQNRSGAQPNHRGHHLGLMGLPDEIIEHPLSTCPHCFYSLKETPNLDWTKAQIIDIPALKFQITEHRLEQKVCPHCQTVVCAKSEGICPGISYSQNFSALVAYLKDYQLMASKRIVEFFRDIFGLSISEGTLFNHIERTAKQLGSFDKFVQSALVKSCVAHADESGLKIMKQLNWLHVLSTKRLTWYSVHQKRGRVAWEQDNTLNQFKGTLIHDHFKPYFTLGCSHALCNAHHLRELQAIFEQTGHSWAQQMQELLQTIDHKKNSQQLTDASQIYFNRAYDAVLKLGYQQQARSPPVHSQPKEICLLDRLKHYKHQTLLFMFDEQVPFTNNQAEQDIRMIKIKMKISGCFRSHKWARYFCLIRSFISTVKKNGLNVFHSLSDLFKSPIQDYYSYFKLN